MIRVHRRISGAVTVLTMAALILTGCTSEASSISSAKNKAGGAEVVDTGFTMSTVGSYDSADTAVVLSTDETNKAVTFINMETGKQYTLYYDGTTYVKDKHDGPMTISQIEPGDVVDVTFLKGKKKLASLKLSPEAWVYDDVYNYDLAGANKTASIGSQSYSLPESVVVLSEGKRVDKAEVVSQDVVTISGIDHKIYSINVDKGHGYLSLKNEQPLLGGWIEVGNSVIRQITEDMLLVVPEGTYQVALNNNGIGCVKEITIERDKEVVLDVDDIEIPEDATGKIIFSVTPENATVSVDGKPVDIGKAVELPYGIHRVEASASGYDTLTKHIQVGSEYATISFKLEETRKEDRDNVSGNSITRDPWEDTYKEPSDENVSDDTLGSVSENALRSSKNGTIEVHVRDWNSGAELKGVMVQLEIEDSKDKILEDYPKKRTSPCSFSKNKDGHTYQFTLSMDGYETKTFEPDLEEYQKDETLYFTIKKKGSSSGTNTSNTRISASVISAVATAGTGCDLTNGPDENTGDAYVTSASSGNLWKTGKEKISEAVKNAVQKVVGTEEIGSYYFKVADPLKDVVTLASGDYEGTASVTVGKNGYKEEIIPVRVVVKQKAVENDITVEVITDPETVESIEPGGTVSFKATVKRESELIPDAEISWSLENAQKEETTIDNGKLTVCSEEPEGEITVIATYTYTDIETGAEKEVPGETTIIIKKREEGPIQENKVTVEVNPTEVGPGETATFTAIVKNGETIVEGATVSWDFSDSDFNGMVYEFDDSLVLEVESVENKTDFTATATYMDISDSATVTIKAPDEGKNTVPSTSSNPNPPVTETSGKANDVTTPNDVKTEVTDTLMSEDSKETTVKADNSNGLIEEEVSMTQNAHPIRNFFSSLFK